MLSLTVLGSGSAGNCALVESPGCRLLIDAGLSARQMLLRLAALGVAPESVTAIAVTHEHIDHVQGIAVFAKKYPVPIYCNPATARELGFRHPLDVRLFQTGQEFSIGDIDILSFPIPHDAADPVGFAVECGGARAGLATDLGHATGLVAERLRGAHTLVVETNYDLGLLQRDTKRPWAIKQRIMSRHGHLSNGEASDLLAALAEHGMRRALLCHLSRDCNTPELALRASRERIEEAGGGVSPVDLHCATQAEPTPRFAVA